MADGIIDIRPYLDDEDDDAQDAFALWGGEGERSRFALPLWRIIYLAEGDRGAILSSPSRRTERSAEPEPLIVLDLRADPARLDFTSFVGLEPGPDGNPELVDRGKEGLTVFLGESAGRNWHLVVDGTEERTTSVAARFKEDILFLSGECAGLLFFRDLARLEE